MEEIDFLHSLIVSVFAMECRSRQIRNINELVRNVKKNINCKNHGAVSYYGRESRLLGARIGEWEIFYNHFFININSPLYRIITETKCYSLTTHINLVKNGEYFEERGGGVSNEKKLME